MNADFDDDDNPDDFGAITGAARLLVFLFVIVAIAVMAVYIFG